MANKTLSDFPVLTNLDAASVTHVQKELVDYQVTLPVLAPYLAQTAISGADEKTDPVDADMVGLMDSAAAGNALKKFSWANFKAKLKTYFDALYPSVNGWVASGQTCTRESATSFSEPIDATDKYGVGDPVKWVDSGGTKYGNVLSVGAYSGGKTIVSLIPNSDYSIASGSITSLYFSKVANPQEFPHWFSYTPILTSGSGSFTSATPAGRFAIIGRTCHVRVQNSITTNGTAAGYGMITTPVTPLSTTAFGGVDNSSGVILTAYAHTDGKIYYLKYDGTYFGANGSVIIAVGFYRI